MRLTEFVGIRSGKISTLQAAKLAYQPISEAANNLLQAELEKFDNNQINKKSFLRRSKKILGSAYRQAYKQGSGLNSISSDGERWIDSFAKKQHKYLESFASDIEASEGVMDYDSRMSLYANAVRAAYWGGSANESDVQMDWVTTAEESCEDCLENEAGSPYDPDKLPGVPGDGSTRCRTNCKCYLVRAR